MRCDRCGKDNPADVHTCSPLALKLADELETSATFVMPFDWLPKELNAAAAELRRLYEENVRLAEATGDKLSPTEQPQPNDFNPDWNTVKAFDDRYNDDTALLRQCLEILERSDCLGYQANLPIIKVLKERLK